MRTLSLLCCLLALSVIVLGAYTRLSDAGLGCPDWPGCYGHIAVPQNEAIISQVEAVYQQPLESEKAWIEMSHRYLAGTLGIGILILAVLALARRQQLGTLLWLPLALVGLVIFQALLGMWTVTLRLLPPIILLHLLGGLSILSGLWWFFMAQKKTAFATPPQPIKPITRWIIAALIITVIQISLGGWTSANYAALICPDFPYCQGQWLPPMNMHALLFSYGIAEDNTTLVTIHMAHRLGALLTLLIVGSLSLWLILKMHYRPLQIIGVVMGLLLIIQVTLGILNIVWLLPLSTAVSHNMIAALLLLALWSALFVCRRITTNDPLQ